MNSLYLPEAWRSAKASFKKKIIAKQTLADSLSSNLVNTINTPNAPAFDAEKDQSMLQALDYPTWLPFAAKTYHISPHIEDYIIIPTIVCPSDLPNRNGIGFPAKELATFLPPPTNRMAYKAWAGCPVHCFTGDTKIRTSKGLRNIKNIKVGDKVLTHKHRFRKVTHVFDNGIQKLKRINCYGITMPILVTDNHPMFVVDRRQLFGSSNLGTVSKFGKGAKNEYSKKINSHFRPVSDIYPLDYLVVPITVGGNKKVDPNFAFLTGLYAAEGNLEPNNKAIGKFTSANFTLAFSEKDLLDKAINCAESLGLQYKKWYNKKDKTSGFTIYNRNFAHAMYDLVGAYSHKKKMKGELRKWNKEGLAHFLGGYISVGGPVKGKHRLRCRTVSEELAQDIQMTFGRLGIPASANNDGGWTSTFTSKYHTRKGMRKNLEGKPFRSNGTSFCISASLHEIDLLVPYVVGRKFKQLKQKVKDTSPKILVYKNHILLPISSIEDAGKEPVFNIEVEEDHTYVAGGVIVHNCEHDNEIHEKAYGVVLDSSLHKVTGYGGGKLWKVMGLLAVDKNKYPDIAQQVLTGEINTYSMGALVDYFTCSYCGQECSSKYMCQHVSSPETINWKSVKDFDGSEHIAFLNAHNIQPIEVSIVKDPAWAPALSDTRLSLKEI